MEASLSHQSLIIFLKSKICNHARMRNREVAMSPPPDCLNLGGNQIFHKDGSSKSLTTPLMQEFIRNTIKFRDKAQNGMPCKEVIQLIMRLTGAKRRRVRIILTSWSGRRNFLSWRIMAEYKLHKQQLPSVHVFVLNKSSAGIIQFKMCGMAIVCLTSRLTSF